MINNPIHVLTYRRKSSEEAKQEIFLMLSDFCEKLSARSCDASKDLMLITIINYLFNKLQIDLYYA